MHEIYELKEMLSKELEEYGKKGEMTAGSLEVVDKLANTIKNLCKIIEAYEEEGYSGRGGSYEGGGSYERGGRSNRSYARGRSNAGGSYRGGSNAGGSYARGRGGNARRDSMGRYSSEGYSRADEMIDQLEELMEEAPDERTRMEIQKLISKMESM